MAHSTLTGADLHEPKGIGTAANNTVYVANGVGSGTWSAGSVLLGITGQISDFATPIAPTGWLECDGSTQLRATFAALFTALTIQQTGSRTNASAVITGLTSTTHMRAGYFVGGVGITNGTTILTVDSPTQVTMSANAGSTGSATVIVSPFAQGDGSTTFTLPDTATSGRYRRSRTSTLKVGTTQADVINTHTHGAGTYTTPTLSGAIAAESSHTHSGGSLTAAVVSGSTQAIAPTSIAAPTTVFQSGAGLSSYETARFTNLGVDPTVIPWTGLTSAGSSHTHGNGTLAAGGAVSGTSAANPGANTETRPISIVLLTCIKT